ncbi:hypothetical protein BDM02DRAFT_3122143 [Thelephora ganbajun]|uniref:Uncharacterized protein n=2 Tax=Thelephora ganbajun TaxID=370292 RepID=A0ACB6Z4K5_THEGA|nr:hypothetical protein BDM02DRAFT_3122434 [Thelephora ganbajun]KAF9644310.1 hypothetical protein BDM02DRAFT_3122143 [Thelephora ganbajun]
MMRLWMATASAVPYTEDIGRSVVTALFGMAFLNLLRPHIPVPAWDWLKKRPVLDRSGFNRGTRSDVMQMVRELQDVELIASYLFVVWSESTDLWLADCSTMMTLIREELCGIEAVGYRADLIQRLDYVLSQLGSWSYTKRWYEEFRTALLEVDEEAMNTLIGAGRHSTFMCALPLPCP